MASYRLTKVSETLHKLTLGRDHIGWVRRWDGGAWEAKTTKGQATGQTASEAFHNLVRILNNAGARAAGFDSCEAMIRARNEEVVREAAEMNKLMTDAGLPPMVRVVRRRRRILV